MKSDIRADLESAAVRTEEGIGVVRFVLPPRPPLRGVARGLTVFGLAITGFMAFWMSGPIAGAFRSGGGPRLFLLIFGLFGLPGLVVGLTLLAGGLALGRGRSRALVEISGGRLRVTEFFPPFRWTWSRKIGDVRRFTLGVARESERSAPLPGAIAELSSRFLRAEGGFPQPLWIAILYPEEVLRPLAEALAEATNRARPGTAHPPVVVDEEGALSAAGPEPDLPRPPNSKVTIQEWPEGFAFHVPPAGLWRGSKGLFFFSVLWLGFCALFFSLVFGAGAPARGIAPVLLFAGVFIGIGLAMLGAALHMGRRSAMVAANERTLGIRRRGPFGTKEQKIPRSEITAIRCGPSGMEINDRPVMELQIHRRNGLKTGCLSQLTEEELRWIAFELRRRLGAPRDPPA